ncbi:restriction endonuclease subunit S [Marinospirillum perlucidum]|uniref:restriction endonuclease subunit S n=1 Tax=Marinospirillum perlucidum TaxID=1982602 RepID=UPI000DF1FB2C|nr:restriction endonuclease subunit S [Marinospirillum perlucidum]
MLGNILCPRPPLFEQTQIARFLDHETAKIDALIHEQERLIELLQEKRQAVISHAVTKGLDPDVPMKDSGVEWLGEVPAHWRVMPAKFLLEFVTSGSRGWAEYYSDAGYLFFRIANLTRDSIRPKLESVQHVSPPESSEGGRAKIKAGDILVSITADLGSVCAADQSVEGGYVSQHVALARPDKSRCHPDWLAYFILGDAAKEQLLGSGYGGTKVQLSLEDIRELVVAVPPLVDQESIAKVLAEKLNGMEALISEANQAVNFLAERRSALISAAVTGKIDVRDWQPPADESAYDEEVRQTGMEATV